MPRLDFMEHGLLCRKCLYNIELKGPIKFNQKGVLKTSNLSYTIEYVRVRHPVISKVLRFRGLKYVLLFLVFTLYINLFFYKLCKIIKISVKTMSLAVFLLDRSRALLYQAAVAFFHRPP